MKKLAVAAALFALPAFVFAQDAAIPDINENLDNEEAVVETEAPRKQFAQWPAPFAICEWPQTPDLVGLRLTIPFSTKQESVTGIDLGFWGRSQYFEGIQVNLLRNDVKDRGTGIQIGLYNSIGQADMLGIQVGLWNETGAITGVQAGLVNIAGEAAGVQVGIVNRAEEMYGFQVGLVNIIRDAEIQFFPIVNVGF